MEGVRRNIALKLKPSVGKDGGAHKSSGEGNKKKEGVVTTKASSVETIVPSSPSLQPATDHQAPLSPKPHPLPQSDHPPTTTSDPTYTSSTTIVSGKVPPDSIIQTGSSLRWDHKVNLLGRAVADPLMHICETCLLPILIYGRMKRCRHAFCRDCAKRAQGTCPRCKEPEQTFEEASMGNVYICTHGGGRYDNNGCGRSYLSQRDLEAHITYRHKDKTSLIGAPQPTVDLTSQTALTSLTMPPFFTMPAGLPPNFPLQSLPPMPPPTIPGSGGQHIFPTRLPVVFVTQGNTTASGTVPLPPTWTTPTVFKPL